MANFLNLYGELCVLDIDSLAKLFSVLGNGDFSNGSTISNQVDSYMLNPFLCHNFPSIGTHALLLNKDFLPPASFVLFDLSLPVLSLLQLALCLSLAYLPSYVVLRPGSIFPIVSLASINRSSMGLTFSP